MASKFFRVASGIFLPFGLCCNFFFSRIDTRPLKLQSMGLSTKRYQDRLVDDLLSSGSCRAPLSQTRGVKEPPAGTR